MSDKANSSNECETVAERELRDFVPTSAILDGKFFTVTELNAKAKVKAVCNSCVKKTVICGSVNVLSNFTTHLKVSKFVCQTLNLKCYLIRVHWAVNDANKIMGMIRRSFTFMNKEMFFSTVVCIRLR
jgi:hypothetical protein